MVFVLLRITKSATVYDHAAYAALPSLGDVRNLFISCGTDNTVNGKLKDILVKHGLTDKFGLALLDSHAKIQSHECLAHFGNSAIPISIKETPPSTLFPCTWKVTNSGVLPFEFYFSAFNAQPALVNQTELVFVEQIFKVVIDMRMEDLIRFSLLANKNSGGHLSDVRA